MSQWSSCEAIIGVFTYKRLSNFKELIEIALDAAPPITGSEGNCKYTIIDLIAGKGDNYPCDRCPIWNSELNGGDRIRSSCPGIQMGSFDSSIASKCIMNDEKLPYPVRSKFMSYYDRCKIVVSSGHGLRDKDKLTTTKEFKELIKYLRSIYEGIFEIEVICKYIS